MEWVDEAIILNVTKFGETSIIANVLTKNHGRYAGLVRGGTGKKFRGIYQPGNIVKAQWKSRLEEQLGLLFCELSKATAAIFLSERLKLSALSSACSIIKTALPERENHTAIFSGLKVFLSSLETTKSWPLIYIKLEIGILKELGFGLDLSSCAATGSTQDLIYLSPKSGRALSRKAGEPYHKKLLKLPKALIDPSYTLDHSEITDAFKITDHFFRIQGFGGKGQPFPQARQRFIQTFENSNLED